MEFNILGPLEVLDDGKPIPIAGRHHPKILVHLLLHVGHFVSIDRLVDILWDDDPPDTARRQVQNAVASLRRTLGSSTIDTRADGYRIAVPADSVDAQRFETHVRDAASARKRGELSEAQRLLREALALWRGDSIGGLSGRAVEAEESRLSEARLLAIEDRVDIDAELGRREPLIGELRELVERHPLRQRLAGQLMTALRHCGRTAEALEVFTELQTRLSDDLGLDPDQRLTELYAAILRGDPPAATPARGRTGSSSPVPAQLPAAPRTFTGRGEHLATLDSLLDEDRDSAVISAIGGMGGVGKTALALHWAHRVRERFPDGQLYINLRGYDHGEPVRPLKALTRLLTSLGHAAEAIPVDEDDAAALYRSVLEDRRVLVVLDNCRDAAHARQLLPNSPGSFALMTSRDKLSGLNDLDGTNRLRLETLTPDESLELLANLVGTERLTEEPQCAQDIVELCGRLPLALRIAGAHLVNQPDIRLADFTAELATHDRLSRLQIAGDAQAAVAAAIGLSFTALSEGGRQLFARLGQCPGDGFSRDLITHVSGQDVDIAQGFLDQLDSAHLIERHRGNRYRFHDLIRDFARLHAESILDTTARSQTRSRFIDWYFERRTSLAPEEMSNVIEGCRAWSTYEPIWRLAVCSVSFVNSAANMAELFPAVGPRLEQAEKSDDPLQLSIVYDTMARLHRARGNRVAVVEYGRKAVTAVSRLPHADSTGEYRSFLASRLIEIGRNVEAQSLLREALRDVTGPKSASLHRSLGNVCRAMGEYEEAERQLEQAWRYRTGEPGDMLVQAVHTDRALLFRDMGRHDEALAEINETLATAQRDNHLHFEIIARLARAKIHFRAGDLSAAKTDALTAFDTASELSRAALTQASRFVLAELAIVEGRPEEAARSMAFVESQNAYQDDPILAADLARVTCDVHNRLGDFEKAVEYGTRAERIYADMPYPLMRAQVQTALGYAYERLGRTAEALAIRNKALEIFTRLEVPEAGQLRELLRPGH